MDLKEIKQNISKTLEIIGLTKEVSLDEIEKELISVETAFQSLLLLGILRRIMYREDEKAMTLFLPAVTEWKNYLPHKDLNGMSPAEHMEKYPVGRHEAFFLRGLMEEYQNRLNNETENNLEDLKADLDKFQKEYLDRVPIEQVFPESSGRLMTIKEIIIEERRQSDRPEKDIDKIGVKIFAENTAEGLGQKAAEIEDKYFSSLEELNAMQKNPRLRNKDRVSVIRQQFKEEEPYHRCGPSPHQFYLNYASVVLLDNGSEKFVKSLLDRCLSFKPDYEPAIKMKELLDNS